MSSTGPLTPESDRNGFEGGGGYGGSQLVKDLSHQPPNSLKLNSAETPRVLYITANVGSIFEEPTWLIPQWLDQVFGEIQKQSPKFVAIHCQEVGGKNFKKSMEHVNQFVNQVVGRGDKFGFDRVAAFFDENYSASDKFTALGSIYLIHKSLANVDIYDFQTRSFSPLTQSHLHLGSVDEVPILEKHKFPLQYFPDSRWSRKGYLRTRWRIGHGSESRSIAFDLINIHLFHDACNLKSVESEGPSIYVNFRKRALQYTLDRIQGSASDHEVLPYFIFGDFNFRLNGRSVVDALDADLRVKYDEEEDENMTENSSESVNENLNIKNGQNCSEDEMSSGEKKLILSIGKKEFRLGELEHDTTFLSDWQRWTKFDLETGPVRDRLTEFPLNFPPTYPFEETIGDGMSYMKTRCPAWCDRVLLSHEAAEKLIHRPPPTKNGMVAPSTETTSADISYDVIGQNVCMGDHKPVFLSFRLNLPNEPLSERHQHQQSVVPTVQEISNKIDDVAGREMPPSIESPSYTDLLDNNIYSRYIELRESAASMKLFKETTV